MRQLVAVFAYITKRVDRTNHSRNKVQNTMTDNAMVEATRRVVATHLSMYKDSCVVSAVEAWRLWNEFPEQRQSKEVADVLAHFGEVPDVLQDISFIMSRLVNSPTGLLDDATLLQELATNRVAAPSSSFLKRCVHAMLFQKFNLSLANSEYDTNFKHDYSGRYYNCPKCCEGARFIHELNAYIARRRMSSL
jgi:hypothetical protein